MRDEPVKIHLTSGQVTQAAWDDFCSGSGLALADNGWFIGGGLRAGCDRATATFAGPGSARVAAAFWLCLGGRISVSDQLQGEIDAVLRERPCMSSQEKVYLDEFGWSRRMQAWVAWARDEAIPLRILAGRKVNLGTKDGVVFGGVTVASFDDSDGKLTFEGGVIGRPYRDEDPAPLVGQAVLHPDDIARGYVHPAAVAA